VRIQTPKLSRGDVVAIFVAAFYGVTFSVLSLLRHSSFNTHTFDLGLHHQATWNSLHGRLFEYTLKSSDSYVLPNLLGDHVNLILLLAVPFYAIHDGAGTLLVLQAIVVGSAAFPLYRIARDVTKGPAPALLFVLLYALNPALHAANLFDFHAIVPAASFLIWALWAALKGHDRLLAVAVVLALSCQENVALAVVCLGVTLSLLGRHRAGAVIAAAGALWFLVCFLIILPHFNPGVGSNAFGRYRDLGATPGAVVVHVLTEPSVLISRLMQKLTVKWLFDLFAPFGFLSVLAPQILVLGASEFLLDLFSSFEPQRTIDVQYAAILVSALALAAPFGARTAGQIFDRWFGVRCQRTVVAAGALALASTIGFQILRYGSLRILSRDYLRSYRVTEHHRLAKRFLAEIPMDATVSAQDSITPHLCRRVVWTFPLVHNADAVLLDLAGGIFPVQLYPLRNQTPEASYYEYVERLLAAGAYRIADAEDGWLLLRRDRGLEPPDDSRPGRNGNLPPEFFRGGVRIVDVPSVMVSSSSRRVALEVENLSEATFFPRCEAPSRYATAIAVAWVGKTTRNVFDPGQKLFLKKRLEPGGRASVSGEIMTPRDPGLWVLQFDLETEGVARFSGDGSHASTLVRILQAAR
jgi:uncharacterized membrane protein